MPDDLPVRLLASLMCADPLRLEEEMQHLEQAGVDGFHLDIMDAHFVPNLALSWDTAARIAAAARVPVDLHLMIERPARFLERVLRIRPAAVAIHPQPRKALAEIARVLRGAGVAFGVAVADVNDTMILPEICPDYILCMTVQPGFAGQPFRADAPLLAQAVQERCPGTPVWADGAIREDRAMKLRGQGVSGFVLGTSGLFRSDRDYEASLRIFRREVI